MAAVSKKRAGSTSSGECVLCCEHINIYSIGHCNHPICFQCASRMRVLAKQKYCAVCRADMPVVVFSEHLALFKDYKSQQQKKLNNAKHGMYFETPSVRQQFDSLLKYECSLCNDGVDHIDFKGLRTHTRKIHSKQYCDICVTKLHIFPREFRCYSREDLVTHRRSGDADNRSYKGHPECRFCDERFLDNDELLSHLRKCHFWCHFCERDGKQYYYQDYPNLRQHFRDEHYLCEEDACKKEEYTAVFRNKLDLQAHTLERHRQDIGKQQARRSRAVDIQLDYRSHKSRSSPTDDVSDRERQRYNRSQASNTVMPNNNHDTSTPTDLEAIYQPRSSPTPDKHEANPTAKPADIGTMEAEFPSLNIVSNGEAPSWIGKTNTNKSTTQAKPKKNEKKDDRAHGTAKSWSKTLPSMTDTDAFPTLPTSKPHHNSTAGGARPKQSQPPGRTKAPSNRPPTGLKSWGTKKPAEPKPVSVASNPGPSTKTKVVNSTDKSPQPNRSSSNANERNARLVEMIQSCLSEEQLLYFRELSAKFRRSEIPSQLYYDDMAFLFGAQLKRVFSELVALLPDEKKQEELLEIHNARKVISKMKMEDRASSNAYSTICKDVPVDVAAAPPQQEIRVNNFAPNAETDFPALPAGGTRKKFRNHRTPTHVSVQNAWGGR